VSKLLVSDAVPLTLGARSYTRLSEVFNAASPSCRCSPEPEVVSVHKEPSMPPLSLAVSAVVALSAGLLLAAAYYTEAHRAPDQP